MACSSIPGQTGIVFTIHIHCDIFEYGPVKSKMKSRVNDEEWRVTCMKYDEFNVLSVPNILDNQIFGINVLETHKITHIGETKYMMSIYSSEHVPRFSPRVLFVFCNQPILCRELIQHYCSKWNSNPKCRKLKDSTPGALSAEIRQSRTIPVSCP